MATKTTEICLVISGDKEYLDRLKNVREELTNQKSAMSLLKEQYEANQNSQEFLTKKAEQLKNELAAQKKVLKAVEAGLKNARGEKKKYAAQEDQAREKLKLAQKELSRLNKETDEGAAKQAELNEEIKKYGGDSAGIWQGGRRRK